MKNTRSSLLRLPSAVAILATAGSVLLAAAGDAPKPAPTATNTSATIGEPYKVLLTRSIFSRDGRAAVVQYRTSNWARPANPSTQPATEPAVMPDPEAAYILRGVGIQDGVFTAFFEQTSENKGASRHIGETVARGQITAMSLDGIEYLLNGKATHIIIGQALDGRMSTVAASPTSSTPAAGGAEKPSWWGHHSHSETPATAPGPDAAGSTPAKHDSEDHHSRDEHRSGDDHRPGDDSTQKPADAGPVPDDGLDPIIIIDPR